jgi:two-component system chemotaxis response regulator CheB
MSGSNVRVLIVDDSALVRKMLSDNLSKEPGIEVVGTAMDPYIARDKILKLNPDVLTLDIEMPRMDGVTFLKLIMKHRPMPVIILSSLTTMGSAKALEALQAGAVDVLAKPSGSMSVFEDSARLAQKIKIAAQVRLKAVQEQPQPSSARSEPAETNAAPPVTKPSSVRGAYIPEPRLVKSEPVVRPQPVPPPSKVMANPRRYPPRAIMLMGASTGGTEALKTVLTALPADMPGICVVQHIPAYFSLAFANRLNELCRLHVREAKQGDVVQPGLVLVAPGGHHMILKWVRTQYVVELSEGPMVHHQRPAVDILFDSAVKAGAASEVMSVLLTGMGADGAVGMLKLRQAGSTTIAQNEETCVVFGMPREAIRMGAAQHTLPLPQIAMHMDRFAASLAV